MPKSCSRLLAASATSHSRSRLPSYRSGVYWYSHQLWSFVNKASSSVCLTSVSACFDRLANHVLSPLPFLRCSTETGTVDEPPSKAVILTFLPLGAQVPSIVKPVSKSSFRASLKTAARNVIRVGPFPAEAVSSGCGGTSSTRRRCRLR